MLSEGAVRGRRVKQMRHLISTHQRPPSLDAPLLEFSAYPKYLPAPGEREGL